MLGAKEAKKPRLGHLFDLVGKKICEVHCCVGVNGLPARLKDFLSCFISVREGFTGAFCQSFHLCHSCRMKP